MQTSAEGHKGNEALGRVNLSAASREIRPFVASDYDEVYRLWSQSEGISLEDDGDRRSLASGVAARRLEFGHSVA